MTTPATMLLTVKARLNPERRQHRAMERILDQQRILWNAALEERIGAWDKGVSISEAAQSKSLTQIRADDPAFADVQRRIQRATLKRLDRAYKAFFRRAKAGAGAQSGFPQFKGRDRFDGFGFDAFLQVKFDGKALRFAGMPGGLRVHLDRPLPGPVKGIWFKRRDEWRPRTKRAVQVWHVGFQVAVPLDQSRVGRGKGEVGVDWGTSMLAALSTGEIIANPRPGEAGAADLARAQRTIARRKKGSKGRRNARARMQAVARGIANRRRERLNKVSKRLVMDYKTVAVEKLDVKNMTAAAEPGDAVPKSVTTRRNREALDAAPYLLRQMLAYKAERYGATLLAIDPAGTTQEAWARMGKDPPRGSIGEPLPRKIIAAQVILERALKSRPNGGNGSSPAEDDRGRPPPGGLDRVGRKSGAAARNAGTRPRRPGNTEGGQPPTGWRPEKSGSSPLPRLRGARDPRTKRSPGW